MPPKTIEKIIREANPELAELSFGCEIEDSQYGIGKIYFKDEQIISAFFPDYNGRAATFTYQVPLTDFHIRQILGHPIQLQHVLRAIQKSGKDVDLRNFVQPMPDNLNIEPNMLYMRRVDVAKWDLAKPFSSQTKDLYNFLERILCGQ